METRFNRKLYPVKAVKAAMEVFADTATLSMRKDGEYSVVAIETDPPEDLGEILGEFENYVLGETIAMRGA